MLTTNRRTLLKQAGLASVLSCTGASILAQTQDAESTKLPFRKLNVAADSKFIAIFFDFNCPFSAEYFPHLISWAATLPKTVKAVHYPVVNPEDTAGMTEQLIAARCFYAASLVGNPVKMRMFSEQIFEVRRRYVSELRSGGDAKISPLVDPVVWVKAAHASGLNVPSFISFVQSDLTMRLGKASAQKLFQYDIRDVPSVGIGGKYLLSPRNTDGNKEMYFNVLNGFVTEII